MNYPLQKCLLPRGQFFVKCPLSYAEGSRAEWRAIIKALKDRRTHQAGRRLAVSFGFENCARLYSPRNCVGPDDLVRIPEREIPAWIKYAEKVLEGK